MSFKLVRPSSRCKTEFYAKPASTVFTRGDLVSCTNNATENAFTAMAATSAIILGVIQKDIAATDSDYASETKVPILVDEDGIWEVPVATGTADANDEGGYIDVDDTATETSVDVTASIEDHFLVTDYVSGTVVRGKIATWPTTVIPVQN